MGLVTLLSGNRSENLFLPAHGRGQALPKGLRQLLKLRPGIWDLPELFEVGGPLISTGAIADSQKSSAEAVGVNRCWYGVNGATGLLQSSLLAIARPGQAVLMPRNVHKSLIQACLLGGITPILFDLPFLSDRGHYSTFNRDWLRNVIERSQGFQDDIAAVVLVNPTYNGYSADMESLIEEIHSHCWPVLVDEAHGAYFVSGLSSKLPKSALSFGADIVVHSLHKSAPGLVQSSVLWLQGRRVDPFDIERSIGLLQTSSPSALLLASCENAIEELISPSGKKRLSHRLNEAECFTQYLLSKGLPLLENNDPLRIILHTGKVGLSGIEADEKFIKKKIIGELPEPGTLTFCLGFSSHKGLARKFVKIWDEILETSIRCERYSFFDNPPFDIVSKPLLPCSKAWTSAFEKVLLEDSIGRIAVEMICPYPPGIPLLVPGELIDKSRVNWLLSQKTMWPDQIPSFVRVVS